MPDLTRWTGRTAALLCGVITAASPAAADSGDSQVSYSIFKEGEPIGHERYRFQRDGEQVNVELTVESAVHILFLDFHYRHQRRESWSGDQLEQLVADTDDDGSRHHVEANGDGHGGLSVQSDGKTLMLGPDAFPLSMWRRAVLGHATLFAVESDDAPYHVTVKDLGSDAVTIGGSSIACQHYALTGDVDRDLWYDADGMLAKVAFRRRGFAISIVRDP